jgi:hypothetical protein
MPESLYHMLISCPHLRMEALWVKLKLDLGELCVAEDGLRDRPMPVLSQSVMWSLMLLCTTSESFPTELRRSVRQQTRLIATEIRDQPPLIDRDDVAAAVNCLPPLVDEWMDRLRQYHNVGDTAVLPGAKVVWYAHTYVLYSGNTARRSRITSNTVVVLETRWRCLKHYRVLGV